MLGLRRPHAEDAARTQRTPPGCCTICLVKSQTWPSTTKAVAPGSCITCTSLQTRMTEEVASSGDRPV